MKIELGCSWDTCPPSWRNMVLHVRDLHGTKTSEVLSYEKIDSYVYEHFRGRLDYLNDYVSCIEFESEQDKMFFILKFT